MHNNFSQAKFPFNPNIGKDRKIIEIWNTDEFPLFYEFRSKLTENKAQSVECLVLMFMRSDLTNIKSGTNRTNLGKLAYDKHFNYCLSVLYEAYFNFDTSKCVRMEQSKLQEQATAPVPAKIVVTSPDIIESN